MIATRQKPELKAVFLPKKNKKSPGKFPSPQPGPQTEFLNTKADIAFFGGSAGGGKSAALLMDFARDDLISNPNYGAVIFRRTYPMLTNPGGLWDEAGKWYPLVNGTSTENPMRWNFPSGATVLFSHLHHEKNKFGWQGSQLSRCAFDEVTHFSETQFFYLLSRARSTDPKIKPVIRATCNPDADSWVAKFIGWWIDEEGYPIPGRSGKLRWFVRIAGQLHWSSDRAELAKRYPDVPAKSVTFIASKLSDNKILMENDPDYRANLLSLHPVERARLLDGNWKVKNSAGKFIKRGWYEIMPRAPKKLMGDRTIRFWDFASTNKKNPTAKKSKDPDFTVGTKMRRSGKDYIILDVIRMQGDPAEVKRTVRNTALADGYDCMVGWEIEPGSAGPMMNAFWKELLSEFNCQSRRPVKAKLVRATKYATQVEAGNVKMVKADWNDPHLSVLDSIPDGPHDDDLDADAGAFNVLAEKSIETRSPGSRSRI